MFIGNKLLSPRQGWRPGTLNYTPTDTHTHTHTHVCTHIHHGTLPHISSWPHCPLLSDWFSRSSPFVRPPLTQLVFISLSDLPPCLLLSLSKRSPFQSYYAWLSALPLRVGLHLSPIRVLLKHTHTDTHHMDLHTVWFISSHVSMHLYKCMQTAYLQNPTAPN